MKTINKGKMENLQKDEALFIEFQHKEINKYFFDSLANISTGIFRNQPNINCGTFFAKIAEG